MDLTKLLLGSVAILSLGLASIYIAERLRWRESRRGFALIALLACTVFAAACALLHLHGRGSFAAAGYAKTLLQMAFAAYFLVSLSYLFHCVEWVLTRIGRRVFLDELLSRILALAVFAGTDLALFFILLFAFGGM